MNRAKFFGLLSGLPSSALTQIQEAYWLAKNAHRWQKPRDNGDRYFEHPRRVAITLIERGVRDKDIITLALLHDVLEDTNTPHTIIANSFPNIIWEWLYILSKYVAVFNPITGQIHDRMKKPSDAYFAAITAAEEPVRLVKLADRRDNLLDMQGWEPERRARYIAETQQYVLPIAEKTDPWFLREITAAIAAATQ